MKISQSTSTGGVGSRGEGPEDVGWDAGCILFLCFLIGE